MVKIDLKNKKIDEAMVDKIANRIAANLTKTPNEKVQDSINESKKEEKYYMANVDLNNEKMIQARETLMLKKIFRLQ